MIQIQEIYESIQGEASYTGFPCLFVRTAGCPLRCRWCDTAYAFGKGQAYSADHLIETILSYRTMLCEFTGGEPLAQSAVIDVMNQVAATGHFEKVLVETSGSEPIDALHPDIHVVMDWKCPGSGMVEHNLPANLENLKKTDDLKFVIASFADFEWAVDKLKEYDLIGRCQIFFSPAFGLVKEQDLVAWILQSGLPIRLNLQVHKYIWSPKKKSV